MTDKLVHEKVGGNMSHQLSDTWEDKQKDIATIKLLHERVEILSDQICNLSIAGSLIVPIMSLAPEPFEVVKEIRAVVQEDEDEEEFTASFFDANVNAGGCNQQEAIDNLKDLLVSRFDYLDSQEPSKLAPPLAKQIAVLREYIRRKN